MAYWTTLKNAINNTIKTNGNQEITGSILQSTLNNIVNSVGKNATFAGIATTTTNPGVPDGPTFYLATTPGIYSNFSGTRVFNTMYVFLWNNSNSWDIIDTYIPTANGIRTLLGLNPIMIFNTSYDSETGLAKYDNNANSTQLIEVPTTQNTRGYFYTNFSELYLEATCFDAGLNLLGKLPSSTTSLIPGTRYFSVTFKRTNGPIDYGTLWISLSAPSNTLATRTKIKNSAKKYYVFGDEMTYYDGIENPYNNKELIAYPSYIRDTIDAEVINCGEANNTSADITTRLLSADLSDAYAITYMAGSNDLHASVPVGTIGEFDTSTYIGNLETAVKHVLTNYPTCKMYFLSPVFESSDELINYKVYADAMESVAKYYNIPILRWDLVSCINQLNADTFYIHENTTRIHLNNEGHKRLADSLIPFLQSY